MTYGNVQRAQSLARAYECAGWSGVFWKTVDGLPVLGAVTAAVDAYREAYALPMTDPRDRARAAGQVTVPIAVAAVGVVGAAYGLAEGIGAVAGAGAARGGAAKGIDPNKLNHIFGDPAHNLGPVVEHFGSQEVAFHALKSTTEAALKSQGLAEGTFRIVVDLAGAQVSVRGAVVNGAVRIGTAFIPPP
jgi:hypothetical protein